MPPIMERMVEKKVSKALPGGKKKEGRDVCKRTPTEVLDLFEGKKSGEKCHQSTEKRQGGQAKGRRVGENPKKARRISYHRGKVLSFSGGGRAPCPLS